MYYVGGARSVHTCKHTLVVQKQEEKSKTALIYNTKFNATGKQLYYNICQTASKKFVSVL